MVASTNTLNTLLNLASKEVEMALEQMAKANKTLQEEKAKGEMLNTYRQDYANNLVKLLEQGIGKEMHTNYQSFLRKLDQAITGQFEVVVSAEYELTKVRKVWQELQRKKLSYEILLDRKSKKEHHVSLKREQKAMDEYAMRAKRSRAL